MKATLTFGVEVPNTQKLTAIRDSCGLWLDKDADVQVTSTNSGLNEEPFTVFGAIKGKPEETYRVVVMATDPADAKAKVLAADKQRTVVAVLSGEVPVA